MLAALMATYAALFILAAPATAQAQVASYTVVAGDTLSGIAARYGVALEALVEANSIEDPALIQIGQVLIIPGIPASETLSTLATTALTALPGETISTFALRTGQDPAVLTSLNNLAVGKRLFPGQPVRVPSTQVPTSPLRFGAVITFDYSNPLIQGRTGRLTLQATRVFTPTATWNGLDIPLTPDPNFPNRHVALLPVPALIGPGEYPLTVGYTATNGFPLQRTWSVSVEGGNYDVQEILVSDEKQGLLDPVLVVAEQEKLRVIWETRSSPLLWLYPFWRPVDEEYDTTSPFGTRRSYGGGPVNGYHAGQDFGAPEGTPVVAPAAGTVVLAESLEVRGNAVVLDHGRGILTGYWHLSELAVEPGQAVDVGDLLGLVGTTGLSTGPHLHWELRIYGIAVDPMQFLNESLLFQ